MIDTLSLPVSKDGAALQGSGVTTTPTEGPLTITGTTGAQQDPEAELVYFVKQDGSLALTWRVETELEDEWLFSYVDAEDESVVLGVVDFISFASYEV